MTGWSVLVVDDEPMTHTLVRMMLEPAGFRVTTADDGLAALASVQNEPPHIVLMDVMMPRMDGLEVCRKLRGQPETADLPIVLFSGKADFGAEAEGLSAGANRYLIKPMSRNNLIECLHTLLRDPEIAS